MITRFETTPGARSMSIWIQEGRHAPSRSSAVMSFVSLRTTEAPGVEVVLLEPAVDLHARAAHLACDRADVPMMLGEEPDQLLAPRVVLRLLGRGGRRLGGCVGLELRRKMLELDHALMRERDGRLEHEHQLA